MNENKTKKMSPVIRFPDFKKADLWQELLLGDIATFSKGKGIAKSDVVADGVTPCIRYGQLYTEYGEKIDGVISHTNVPIEKLVLSQSDDVIIPASGETQIDIATASCVKKEGVALGGDLNIIRSKNDGTFLSYYLNSAKKHRIAQLSQGVSVIHLYANQLKTLKVHVPSLTEQQKIASFLSSIDQLITVNISQLEALKTHKKGLMQKLFPAEDEAIPKLRFPEFNEDLIKTNFAELGEIKIGLTHKPEYIESGIPFLSSKNISKGYIDFDDIKYISEEKFKSMPDSTKPQMGDILFTRVGSNLGNPIVLEENKEFGIFVSLGFFRVNTKVSNYFMKYWMDSECFWSQVNQKVAGGAKNNLNSTWLKEFSLFLPSLLEQEKVAKFLLSVDKLIDMQVKKIESMKIHKNGLLQQLFPSEYKANS